jgi:hypothetical protein
MSRYAAEKQAGSGRYLPRRTSALRPSSDGARKGSSSAAISYSAMPADHMSVASL